MHKLPQAYRTVQYTAQGIFLIKHETGAVLEHVAANLKRLRAQNQMSQQVLADQSGISRRMVAALENCNSNISLAKLSQLAAVLGVSFAHIVSPYENDSSTKRNVLTWRGNKPGSEAYLSCSITTTSQVELWMWSIAPGDHYQAEPDPDGWYEMLHIIEGTLTLTFNDETQTLSAGESVVYSSAQSYSYHNLGNTTVRFIRNVVG